MFPVRSLGERRKVRYIGALLSVSNRGRWLPAGPGSKGKWKEKKGQTKY